ncbi:MAG: tetracycline resistance MFS efflux pump, partial [Burkholderiales bacterium]|nr:tetracycline resistance MFS efflux pump [Burkholderiales bacterium]
AQAIMTKHVGVSEQGQLQGASASLMSLAGIFAPALFALIFAATLDTVPGAAFILAGAMLLLAMAIGWRVTRPE